MILNELFDRATQYNFVRDWQAQFNVDDKLYLVDFLPTEDAHNSIEIMFSMRDSSGAEHDRITNTGGELIVFGTVIACARQYLSTHSVNAITFTASKKEPSRVRLYDRLVKQLLPQWRQSRVDQHGSIEYMLINPKVDAPQQSQGQGSLEDIPF